MIGRSVTLAIAAALYSTASALAQTPPTPTSPAQPPPAEASPAQAAPAQMPSPTSEQRTPDITELAITPEQQAKIKALAGTGGASDSPARLGTGATLPPGIELRELPAELGLGPYRYARVGGQIVVVDPDTNRIIQAF